jgi:AraC family transcriptional regulator
MPVERQYKGEFLRRRTVGSVTLIETAFAPNLRVPRHTHEHAYISFLLNGSYTEEAGGETRACLPGSVIFHPRGETHSDGFHRFGGQLLNLQLAPEWLDAMGEAVRPWPRATNVIALDAYSTGVALHHGFDSLTVTASDNLAVEVVAQVAREQRLPPFKPWMARALEFVHSALTHERELSLRAAAEYAGIHPIHLARSFRKYRGITFSQYVLAERLRLGLRRLLESSDSITRIAMECGFADHPHFCRAVKSVTGFAPSHFRRHFSRTPSHPSPRNYQVN